MQIPVKSGYLALYLLVSILKSLLCSTNKHPFYMRNIVLTLICLWASCGMMAQTCIPAGTSLVLNSQQDIDDFSYIYSGCTQVEGNIFVQDMAGDITNLDGLSAITSVGGYIYIRENPLLTDITGLSNITTLGDFIFMYFNELLTDLDGLQGISDIPGFLYLNKMDGLVDLTGLNNVNTIGKFIYLNDNASINSISALSSLSSIGGFLIARNNDNLGDLTGLEGLTTIPGILHIANNQSLTSLTGLDNVTSVDSFTYILNNDALTSFTGLESLTTIQDYLYINDNVNVQDFNAFSNLTSVGGNFYIGNSPQVTSMAGFENLSSINGIMSLFNCDDLVSIDALDGVDPTTITDLNIEQNNDLKLCESTLVCSYLSNPSNAASITANHPACGNRSTVEDRCLGIYPIRISTIDQCESAPSVEISSIVGNTNEDVHILDTNCDILCTINANGNDLGTVYFESFISSATRYVGMSYINRDITITPSNQPSSPVDVTLYYTAAEFAALQVADPAINATQDLITRKNPDYCSAGIDIFAPTINQTVSGAYGTSGDVYLRYSVNAFSTFYQHGSDILILPVELISFKGEKENDKVRLDWSTLTEVDNDYFTVEHSENGREFTTLGKINGANNSTARLDYQYLHTSPNEGANYYRLLQTDMNGASSYSEVINVEFAKVRLGMYPNPATQEIVIGSEQQESIQVFIYNNVGKELMHHVGQSNSSISIAELPTGIYNVIVLNTEGSEKAQYRLLKL